MWECKSDSLLGTLYKTERAVGSASWGEHSEQEGGTLIFTRCIEDKGPQSGHQERELPPRLREHLKQDGVVAAERSSGQRGAQT